MPVLDSVRLDSENATFVALGEPQTLPPILSSIEAAATLGGTIEFSGDGVIEFTSPITFVADGVLDANGHHVVLNGNGVSSLLQVSNGVSLTLKGVTLINGKAPEVLTATNKTARGGALVNDGGNLTLIECVFSNNIASVTRPDQTTPAEAGGGVIWQWSGSLNIQACVFTNNQAIGVPWIESDVPFHKTVRYPSARGGAIAVVAGDVEVSDSIFGGNVVSGLPGDGGAIFFSGGDLLISESDFNGNGAGIGPRGGALHIASGNLSLNDSTLSLNSVDAADVNIQAQTSGESFGGALYHLGTAILSSTTFLSNRTVGGIPSNLHFGSLPASMGGAIFSAGTMSVINSTFSGDHAISPFINFLGRLDTTHGQVSAVYSAGRATITNSTFRSGIFGSYMLKGESSTNLIIKSSLFDYPRIGGFEDDPMTFGSIQSFTDAGNNLSSDAPAFTETTSQTNLNLRLGPVADYGGSTPTIPLLSGSPAIDAADDSAAPATDQRGRTRPSGAHADVGAFESSAPFHVWGRIKGFIDPTTILTVETNTFGSVDGTFLIGPLPSGINEIGISADNALFLPNPWMIDATVDGEIAGPTSFELHSLTYYGTSEDPEFILAGLPGETWKVEMTQDFDTWADVGTYTIGASGLVTVPVPDEEALYLRVIAQE